VTYEKLGSSSLFKIGNVAFDLLKNKKKSVILWAKYDTVLFFASK